MKLLEVNREPICESPLQLEQLSIVSRLRLRLIFKMYSLAFLSCFSSTINSRTILCNQSCFCRTVPYPRLMFSIQYSSLGSLASSSYSKLFLLSSQFSVLTTRAAAVLDVLNRAVTLNLQVVLDLAVKYSHSLLKLPTPACHTPQTIIFVG